VRVPIDNLGPVAGDQGVFNSDGNPQAKYYRAGTLFQPLTEAQVYYDSDKIRSITGVAGGLDFDSTNEQQTVSRQSCVLPSLSCPFAGFASGVCGVHMTVCYLFACKDFHCAP